MFIDYGAITVWVIIGLIIGSLMHLLDKANVVGGILSAIITGILGALAGGLLSNIILGNNLYTVNTTTIIGVWVVSVIAVLLQRLSMRKKDYIKTDKERLR